MVDDGLSVQSYTDTTNQSDAKVEVCKVALVELLLRAPHRHVVRLFSVPFQRVRARASFDMIWDIVHHLQIEMRAML